MKSLIVILIAAMALAGCTTVSNTARTLPDGTKELEQQVSVPPFGQVKEGMLDFTAESIGADGSNWQVQSGTAAKDVTTDVNIQTLSLLMRLLGPLLAPP